MNNNGLTIGQKLRLLRSLKELTISDLAKELGVNEASILAWENDEMKPDRDDLSLICNYYNLPSMILNEYHDDYREEEYNEEDYEELDNDTLMERIIENCKNKLKEDGIEVKDEYLPQYDAYHETIFQYGVFDAECLPVIEDEYDEFEGSIEIDQSSIDDKDCYQYNVQSLITHGLYDYVKENYHDIISLDDLTYCDDVELYEIALDNHDDLYSYQESLNSLLENLDANLSHFWEIIVLLIDNGAYYEKEVGMNNEYFSSDNEDVSKTNLVYRIAKDKIEQ